MTQHVEWRVVDEGGTFRWGYLAEQLVAEWPGILTLRATPEGDLTALEVAPGASKVLVEKVRSGAGAAFLRAQRGRYSLHASAVRCNGEALVLVGESGAGKSTLADRLCRHPGCELLADDVAAIELFEGNWHVLPSEASLWLDRDGSALKSPAPPLSVAELPAPLRWVVSVALNDAAPAVTLRELRGADAASALFRSLIRFERSPALFERELAVVGGLVAQSRMLATTRSRQVRPELVAEELLAAVAEEAR